MQPEPSKPYPIDSRPPNRRRRSLFVPGFALGFLLLTALSCGGALYAAGIDGGKLAELRGNGAVAWTPPPTPVHVPGADVQVHEPSPDAEYAFRAGDRPYNITASLVNLRASPGYLGKPSDDVVAQAAPGQQVEILSGPQHVDGLLWWYVRLLPSAATAEGWMAEATGSGVQILGE